MRLPKAGIMMLLAKIIKHLAIWPARIANRRAINAAAAAPPVLFIVVKENPAALHTQLIAIFSAIQLDDFSFNTLFGKNFLPNLRCFIVARNVIFLIANKTADVDFMRIQPNYFCQKFEKPLNLLTFEIFAHTPIAQHLKERRVAIIANILNILRPQTRLAISQFSALRMILAQQIRQQRLHARASKQRRRVVV